MMADECLLVGLFCVCTVEKWEFNETICCDGLLFYLYLIEERIKAFNVALNVYDNYDINTHSHSLLSVFCEHCILT